MLLLPTIRRTPIKDAYISEYYPNQNFGGVPYLYISQYEMRNDDYRSLLQFSLRSIPSGRRIVRARLLLTIYRNEIPAGTRINVSLRRIVSPWREFGVTWNNQPASRFVSAFSVSSAQSPGSVIGINVSSLVRRWYNGSIANRGIVLRGNESRDSLLGFYSGESGSPPRLIVTYVRA